jgi:hypothetical protein
VTTLKRRLSSEWIWVALLLILAGTAAWNLNRARALSAELKRRASDYSQLTSRMVSAEEIAHKLTGHRLDWPRMEQITSFPEKLWDGVPGPRLVLFFQDVSCNVCDENEVAFANRLVAQVGADHFAAVVEATDRRYAAAFVRVNRSKFSIYYDSEKVFRVNNPIKASPLLILLNERREVLSAHHPIPNEPTLCRAFETSCRRLFFRGDEPKS